ncbi:MAG: hypothetical protein JXA95_05725 [Spirochaetales bacterium]|nr:hypothetical protein [Spirochaetales bacterium]
MNKSNTGFHPFWFWNGDMNIDEIKGQIDLMHEQGINGFYIHLRQGMTLPYLSERFFEILRRTAEYARGRGMTTHIYDEYPYPTGSAGGFVTLGRPEYRGTWLTQENYRISGGAVRLELPDGCILNATLVPLEGDTPDWEKKRDVTSHVGMVLVDHTYHAGGLTSYNQKRYFASRPMPTLIMDLDGGEYLLCVSVQTEMTRFKYWGTLPDVLNPKAMEEFFRRTHEAYANHFKEDLPSLFYSTFSDELEPVWSAVLPHKYREIYGDDLLPLLPALVHDDFPDSDRIRQGLHRLKYNLFEETFEKPLQAWCREKGVRYCGEKPSLYMRQLRYMDIPGCEPGHTKAGRIPDLLGATLRGNARACASAAQFYGKEGSLCECYHSLGWSGTLLDARIIAESLVLMGITMLVPHGYFYTTHGLTKHDAPPTFFFQMPFWPLTHVLSEKIAHIQKSFEGSEMRADIFVYEPSGSLPTGEEQNLYKDVLFRLAGKQLDFLMVEPEIIRNLGSDLTGKTLLVIHTVSEEPEKAEALESFTNRGGRVMIIEKPEDLDGVGLSPLLDYTVTGRMKDRLWTVTREKENGERLGYFLNTSDEPLEICFSSPRFLTEFHSGVPITRIGDRKTIAPFESFLIEKATSPSLPPDLTTVMVSLPRELPCRRLGLNYLRLERWEMELNGIGKEVSAAPLINQIDEGDFLWRPQVHHHFGWMPDLEGSPQSVIYRCMFTLNEGKAAGDTELMIEPGSLRGKWEISINGGSPLAVKDLTARDYPVQGTEGLSIGSFLKEGENTIEIHCETVGLDEGLVSPLYLAGRFSVRPDDSLSEGDREGYLGICPFDDYRAMGLPYYSGQLLYSFDFDYQPDENGREKILLEVTPPVLFQDAMEISLNGGPFIPAPWLPYRIAVKKTALTLGKNRLEIRVSTSLIRTFEGTRFDIKEHRYEIC